MSRRLPDAQRAVLVAAYVAGERLAAIAARFGVSVPSVSLCARQAGVPRRVGAGKPAPAGEHTAPRAGAPLRAPLLPWYTAPEPLSGLAKLIVREADVGPIRDPFPGRAVVFGAWESPTITGKRRRA